MDRILGLDAAMFGDLILQLLNTVILSGLLTWILYKPVLNFLKKRTERINAQISSAATELSNAEKLRREYEEKLKQIDKERIVILEEARKRASDKEAQILADAKAEADTIKARAMLEIDREKQKAKDDMKVQIIEISSLMASRYVKSSMDKATGSKLLDDVINDLGDAKWLS